MKEKNRKLLLVIAIVSLLVRYGHNITSLWYVDDTDRIDEHLLIS